MSAVPSRLDDFSRVRVFDLDFVDAPNLDDVRRFLLDVPPAEAGEQPVIVTPNVDIVVRYHAEADEALRTFVAGAWCILPDGQPVVTASRWLGRPLSARLCGSDLFAEIWPELVARNRSVVVLASSDTVADGLRAEHRGAAVVVAPVIDASRPEDVDAVAATLEDHLDTTAATLVLLGLGHPKDARIAAALYERRRSAGRPLPYVACLGGSAEMYLGIRKRAPEWVQRIGAEWLYRFAQEPTRLFRRYFIDDVAFLGLVAREYRAKRRGPKGGKVP